MLFNSLHFLIFFPVIVAIYFLLPGKYRTILLLFASYYFYMSWKPEYALLIIASTLVDYFAALGMNKSDKNNIRKYWLLVSLCSNIGILFFFKYANFFSENINLIIEPYRLSIPYSNFLLPVGISFYTFQTLSYTIDVYRRKINPENSFFKFALYVSFFPQLVAGPIERANRLLPQMHKVFLFNYSRIVSGLRLMLWGFFKKVVIADRLALIVNQVYNNPDEQSALTYIVATYFFAFQIYCDFSGYSDIAIGSARILGYDLMKNFRIPYISKSIREFWQRWHISLSTWFRDYFYISLGGNKVVKWRWYFNLLITFVVSGLWHGASWTFVVWGALHGVYLIVERFFIIKKSQVKEGLLYPLQIFITFHLVLFSWVFFRANSINQAFSIISEIAINTIKNIISYFQGEPIFVGFGTFGLDTIFVLILLIIGFFIVDVMQTNKKIQRIFLNNFAIRYTVYFILFYSIVFGGYFGETQFIYFQF